MILYHGSKVEVSKPDILHSRKNVDFGQGFYTTPIIEQANNWCNKFIRRDGQAVLSKYEFDETAFSKCRVLSFEAYSEKWLDFVLSCRKGKDKTDYDIVVGGVANDKVFDTVELFFDGLIDKNEAIRRLKYTMPNAQICIRSQSVLDTYLHFVGSERL